MVWKIIGTLKLGKTQEGIEVASGVTGYINERLQK